MKKALLTTLFILITHVSFSQNYGMIDYMGKKFPVNSDFFKDFNDWINARGYSDYNEINQSIVLLLKDKSTTLFIDEGKNIHWQSNYQYPYCDNCKEKKWKRRMSATIMFKVLLPLIDFYEEHYNR